MTAPDTNTPRDGLTSRDTCPDGDCEWRADGGRWRCMLCGRKMIEQETK